MTPILLGTLVLFALALAFGFHRMRQHDLARMSDEDLAAADKLSGDPRNEYALEMERRTELLRHREAWEAYREDTP